MAGCPSWASVCCVLVILPGTEGISTRVWFASVSFGGSSSHRAGEFAIRVDTHAASEEGHDGAATGQGLLLVVVIGTLVYWLRRPDLSVAMMFCLLMAVLLFVEARCRILLFGIVGLLLVDISLAKAYVRARVESFLHDDGRDQSRSSPVNDQQYQSLVAVGAGGLVGVGFGQGNQQRGWLPLAYNDFIGSIVGEEFGFIGVAGLTLAFALYGWLGFRIARQARSSYLTLLAIGLTFTTVFTAFIHLGVVIRLLPNTGLTLPFVSYGRSNLVLTLAMTGILVNIGSMRERVFGTSATDPLVSVPAGDPVMTTR